MLENIQRIRLDICDNQTYEQIYIKQYNKGFPIEFEITKNGKPFDLSGIVAIFEFKKPDGKFVVDYADINENIVSVTVEDYMTSIDGKAKFQITLFDEESYDPDNKDSAIIISTVTCTMKIDKATVQNKDIEASKDVFNIVTEVLIEIENAKIAAQNAEEYMNKSLEYSNNSKASATASANSASAAKTSENNAKTYASNANKSETNAKTSETNALSSANSASSSANSASTSASNAKTSETQAKISETNAKVYATNASNSATSAQNYATGSTNSAKYYYEQAKTISESFSGALRPMGTVTFANLPSISSATEGDMYNVSNEFTTTADFKEGAGHIIPQGANIYKTFDGMWDILAGTPVTGIKGDVESSYRAGNVNISKSDIGLGNVEDKSSKTIRSELTKENVTNALGYTPVYEIISSEEPTNQNAGDFWLQSY